MRCTCACAELRSSLAQCAALPSCSQQSSSPTHCIIPKQGLELKSIINNSPHGDSSQSAPAPDDLIYVAHVPEGIDAADYIHTVLANARETIYALLLSSFAIHPVHDVLLWGTCR